MKIALMSSMTQARTKSELSRVFAYGAIFAVCFILYLPAIISSFTPSVHSWAVTDLLINYQGGFVRRGLLGEVAFQLAGTLGIPQFLTFPVLFALATLVIFLGLAYLLYDYKSKHLLTVAVVVLSPALMLFQVYDPAAYFRKEILCVSVLVIHAIVAKQVAKDKIQISELQYFHYLFLLPALSICIFVHEAQLFLLPAHFCITFLLVKSEKLVERKFLLLYAVPAALAVFPLLARGNEGVAVAIIDSLTPTIAIDRRYDKAIGALSWTLQDVVGLSYLVFRDEKSILPFLFAWELSLIPSIALGWIVCTSRQWAGSVDKRLIVDLTAISAISPLVLIAAGWDFGRWIHVGAMASVLFLLSIPINNESSGVAPRNILLRAVAAGVTALMVFAYVSVWTLPHCCTGQSIIRSGLKRSAGDSLRTIVPPGLLCQVWRNGCGK